jgi:hypothetical protein
VSQRTKHRWEAKRTAETRQVESVLRAVFPKADAYRYNPASIRVRVIDPRFEGKSSAKRYAMIEPLLERLPERIQADIINLLTLSPVESADPSHTLALANLEFEDPSPSTL